MKCAAKTPKTPGWQESGWSTARSLPDFELHLLFYLGVLGVLAAHFIRASSQKTHQFVWAYARTIDSAVSAITNRMYVIAAFQLPSFSPGSASARPKQIRAMTIIRP